MVHTKMKGYRAERKIKLLFEKNGWIVVRAGASLGEADLICMKNGTCLMLQIKSSKKKKFYYYGYMQNELEKFPFLLVIDFGYGKIRVMHPQKVSTKDDGQDVAEFLRQHK